MATNTGHLTGHVTLRPSVVVARIPCSVGASLGLGECARSKQVFRFKPGPMTSGLYVTEV